MVNKSVLIRIVAVAAIVPLACLLLSPLLLGLNVESAGDTITRSYTFEELKSKPLGMLEYHHDNFSSPSPLPDSLKWKVETTESSTYEWNKTYGGTNHDWASALVQTADGGYALAGGTRSFGAGSSDFWLVKTDAAGNMMWNKTYGGTSSDYASALVQTGDGGYALAGGTGSFGAGNSDFWLVKTDASGTMQWNQTYGGTDTDEASALVQTTDGGYALAGETTSFGAGNNDAWLVRTDASGNMMWNRTYGGTIWDDVSALVQTSDEGYALAGMTYSLGIYSEDFWLVKTDAAGNALWNRTYGGYGYEWAYDLVQTGDGGYALAGQTWSFGAGSSDFWLVKTDAAGTMQWNQTYGGTEFEAAWALVQTSDGGYALAGWTWSFGAGNGDCWLVKIDANGNMMWNKTYGGADQDYVFALVQTGDGGYALAGSTWSFGAGNRDFWLVKTKWDGPIYIRLDGSVDPPTAPISSVDEVTYVSTGDVVGSIVVERDDIVVNGAGHVLYGTGSGNGIDLGRRSNVTVENMSIIGFSVGIWLDHSSSNCVSGNNISNTMYGILLGEGSNNTIVGNNVTLNDWGIYLESSSNNSIVGNNVTANNGDGIFLSSCSNDSIVGNNVTANNGDGIFLSSCSNDSIVGNNVTLNDWGIYLESSSNNSIVGNNVTLNDKGIWLVVSPNSSVSRNTMAGNNYNFWIHGDEFEDYVNYVDSSNTVNGKPVYYLIDVENLTVDSSAFPAIGYLALINSTRITVKDLTLTNNCEGLLLAYTKDCEILNNTITNNLQGVLLWSSSNNTLYQNSIAENEVGIDIQAGYIPSSNNILYHNSFANNTSQAYDTPGYGNVWYGGYPSGGNYWSDYSGIDVKRGSEQDQAGSDGIGDTPYVFESGSNWDRYPLMKPWLLQPSPPVAFFTYNDPPHQVGAEKVFDASSSFDWDGDIVSYCWDFGDGNITSTPKPVIPHIYAVPGVFNVTLAVFDSEGLNSSFSREIAVVMPTFVSISTSSSSTFMGFKVDINGTLHDSYGNGVDNESVVLYYTRP